MNELTKMLDDLLNPDPKDRQTGVALLFFPFGGPEGGRVNYISNGRRENMIVAMKEWLARAEGRVIDTNTRQ